MDFHPFSDFQFMLVGQIESALDIPQFISIFAS